MKKITKSLLLASFAACITTGTGHGMELWEEFGFQNEQQYLAHKAQATTHAQRREKTQRDKLKFDREYAIAIAASKAKAQQQQKKQENITGKKRRRSRSNSIEIINNNRA